jgi:hypothetical protein
MKAANSGDDDDVQAATDQVAIALRGAQDDDVMRNRPSPPTKVLTLADYPGDMVRIACLKSAVTEGLSASRAAKPNLVKR